MTVNAHLAELYQERFKDIPSDKRRVLWRTLCNHFFQRYITQDMHVLDLGAGYCEFINAIRCKAKCAVDLNKEFVQYADSGVTCFVASVMDLSCLESQSMDMVFMSNLLEHLPTKTDVLAALRQVHNVLKPNGRIMLLQPNIRYLYHVYWDFFDHNIPLSDRSVVEALRITGFSIQKVIPKFLPYTTKNRLPKHPLLVKGYLLCPPVWTLLGKQMFILAEKQ